MRFRIRKDTTDIKVIDEVIKRQVYRKKKIDFDISPDDYWLDLGANIGTFTCLALSKGAKVDAYEPEPDNFRLLSQNVKLNNFENYKLFNEGVNVEGGKVNLYLSKGDYNKYRHTIYKKRGREFIEIKMKKFKEAITDEITAIKIDIEGAEVEILESMEDLDWKNVKKLVFEYSFDLFPNVERYRKIIDKLKKKFNIVHEGKNIPKNVKEYKFFPGQTFVYCLHLSNIFSLA